MRRLLPTRASLVTGLLVAPLLVICAFATPAWANPAVTSPAVTSPAGTSPAWTSPAWTSPARTTGTWSISPSPDVGTGANYLAGVSCSSGAFCVAVGGDMNSDGVFQSLIEEWNGRIWSVAASPDVGSGNNSLSGVSCVSAWSCVAVGEYDNTLGVSQNLVEEWNGRTWSVSASPDVGTGDNALSAVSCPSAWSCMAVGDYQSDTALQSQTLTEWWNGRTWTVVASPDVEEGDVLASVSCPSIESCQAVGSYLNADLDTSPTLVESWDGSSWSIAPSPSTGSFDQLQGVSCPSAGACMAVGYSEQSSGAEQTLTEWWNGTTWSILDSPDTSAASALQGLSCSSTASCTAAGGYYTSAQQPVIYSSHTLVEEFSTAGPFPGRWADGASQP